MDTDGLMFRLGGLRLKPFERVIPLSQVPCNELSNPGRLCRRPLVSVLMTTYNHADNIKRAIEGVMMQQTDFPLELIIGEDASQDGTREICFDMQKRYPDRIRVLWSPTNVYALNGNGRRVRQAARGEFIAYCEGDDYWIDPHKLQRQVELMRCYPNVGICLGGTEVEHVTTRRVRAFPYSGKGVRIVPGRTFVAAYLRNGDLGDFSYNTQCFQTSGFLLRREAEDLVSGLYPFCYDCNWHFRDLIRLTTIALDSDVAFILDAVSRYRLTEKNVTATMGSVLLLDGLLYDLYLHVLSGSCSFDEALETLSRRLRRCIGAILAQLPPDRQRDMAMEIRRSPDLSRLFLRAGYSMAVSALKRGVLCERRWRHIQTIGRIMEFFTCKG